MAIAQLYEVPPDPQSLASWAFSHMVHHRDIIARLNADHGLNLDTFILDPIDPSDMAQWLYQHQVMHNQMNAVLGISGFNLSELDWQEPDLVAAWISMNANEHYQAATILNIG